MSSLALARRVWNLLSPDAWRRSIAVLQVFGGGLGMANLLLTAWGELSRNESDLPNLLGTAAALIVLFMLFAISFIAGIGLWSEERHARPLSMFVQAIQIIQFRCLGVSYSFIVAGGLSFFVEGERVGFTIHNGSGAAVHWAGPSAPAMLGLNLVALALFCVLHALGNRPAVEREMPVQLPR